MQQLKETVTFEGETLNKTEIAEMELYTKYDKSQTENHFDRVSENYDAIHQRVGYYDPENCANLVDKLTKKEDMSPGDVEVLDFGCGTGMVGECLSKLGYNNISGLDISKKMIDLAD